MRAKTFDILYGYTEAVLSRKPHRRSGEDVRSFPTYTIPEAAIFLGIPSRTLWEWFSGTERILHPSGSVDGLPLLSFNDAVEAYAVHLLRSHHHLSMQSLRGAINNLPRHTKARNPLVSEHLKVLGDHLVLERPARGKYSRHVVNLSLHDDAQLVITHIVDIFANRVLRDSAGKTISIFPWRHWTKDQISRPVQIDPSVMSGRPVVSGTRIPVQMIYERFRRGQSAAFIADDCGLPVDSVEKALRHFDKKAA